MSPKLKKSIKYIVSVLVAALLLYLCFRNVKWADFKAALLSCKWGYVILSMAFGALSFWLRGARWKLMIEPIDSSVSIGSCFNAVNISYLANMVFPRLGELVRCGYITKNSARGADGKKLASYDKVLGTMFLDRAWDIVSMLIVLFLTLGITWRKTWGFYTENVVKKTLGGMSLSGILIAILVAIFVFLVAVYFLRDKNKTCAKIWGFMAGIWKGIVSSLHMKHGWLFIILTIGIWCCYWMMSATIVWSVKGMDIGTEGSAALQSMNLLDALFLMVVGATSSIVPVPGGFGAYHYMLSLAIQGVYGIPIATGIIFATLSHESQIVVQIICGAASYFAETFKKAR